MVNRGLLFNHSRIYKRVYTISSRKLLRGAPESITARKNSFGNNTNISLITITFAVILVIFIKHKKFVV